MPAMAYFHVEAGNTLVRYRDERGTHLGVLWSKHTGFIPDDCAEIRDVAAGWCVLIPDADWEVIDA